MRVVVAGAGIAGLTASLHAAEAGYEVTLVTKGALGDTAGEPGCGSTPLAQGGVAGVYGVGDSPAQHAADTLAASAGLADPAAVRTLVADGPVRIAELIARGVGFDRAGDGSLLRGREAAHSHARIVHAGGDATGAAIALALADAVRRSAVTVVERAFLADVLTGEGRVRGVRLLHAHAAGRAVSTQTAVSTASVTTGTASRTEIAADAVILATGGAGEIFAHTTNPAGSTGDGIAAAMRAGAEVADLEFVQFHPTVLAASGPAFLISEAVRGEGATLIDDDSRRFVFDTHPDGELAPRDVVARAIARRAAEQGSPVLLNATALGRRRLAERFPTIDRVTRERGFDWAQNPLAVTPAAHYLMGGIVTDLEGRTSVPGLFAVGEVARTGVHGANRLASNSLLEGAVFAARAVRALAQPAPTSQKMSPNAAQSGEKCDVDEKNFSRAELQTLMWDRVGLLRTDEGLAEAVRTLDTWRAPTPATIAEHEDANLLLVARATASAALARTESIGAHWRTPSPVLIGV